MKISFIKWNKYIVWHTVNLTVENVLIEHIECFASKLKPGDCLGNKEKGALSSTVHKILLNFVRRKFVESSLYYVASSALMAGPPLHW